MHYTELFLKGPFVIVPAEYLRGGHYIAMIILFQWASIGLTHWTDDRLTVYRCTLSEWLCAMVCSLDHCALCSVTIQPYNLALSSVCDINKWRRVCYISLNAQKWHLNLAVTWSYLWQLCSLWCNILHTLDIGLLTSTSSFQRMTDSTIVQPISAQIKMSFFLTSWNRRIENCMF